MSSLKKLSVATAGAVVLATVVIADTIQAITITTRSYDSTTCGNNGCTSSQPGATQINFDNGTAPSSGFATYTLNGSSSVKEATVLSNLSALVGDTTRYLNVEPNSNTSNNSVTINFSSPVSYFGLYWGSIDSSSDSLNTISFYRNGNSNPQTFDGSQILASVDTNPQGNNVNRYVNFSAEANESFNRVVLSSTGQPFESDNHAYIATVPFNFSPTLGFLVLGAWGAMAQLKRKVQKWKFPDAFSNK